MVEAVSWRQATPSLDTGAGGANGRQTTPGTARTRVRGSGTKATPNPAATALQALSRVVASSTTDGATRLRPSTSPTR